MPRLPSLNVALATAPSHCEIQGTVPNMGGSGPPPRRSDRPPLQTAVAAAGFEAQLPTSSPASPLLPAHLPATGPVTSGQAAAGHRC